MPASDTGKAMPPAVAIVMRAKNEMPHVQRTLELLQHQTFSDFELFAVDSGSTDGTLEALQAACTTDCLTRIPAEEYQPGSVLNAAIARTDHEVIVLLNADAVPCSDTWLETLTAPIFDGHADATFSRQVPREDAHFIVTYDYQRAYDPDRILPHFFSAVACAFRRELWASVPFREQGYAEDAIWAKAGHAAGTRIKLVTDSMVEHSHNYTFRQLYAKKRRQALAMAQSGIYKANPAAQAYVCIREIVRDLYCALRRLKPATIPYNMAYRMVSHAGTYAGLRQGRE